MRRLLPLLVIAAVGACAHEGDEPMIILGNTAQMEGSVTCSFTGDPTQPITTSGVISTVSPSGYLASPLIQSRITGTTDNELERTIEIQGAIVQLSVPNGSQPIDLDDNEAAFQALFSASVPPQSSVNVTFDLIPSSVVAKVAGLGSGSPVEVELVAQVTVYGLLGGDRVTAQPWQYPVTICNDCVVSNDGVCPLTTTTIRVGDPCNIFQDGVVDCCTNPTTGALICPGPTM
ncbi:MAG TPA: hypothetical protein VGF94_11310 [Kofleriaceae bacterium]|jgi:hypothetical protein